MITLPRLPWLRFTPNVKRCGLTNRRALAQAPLQVEHDGTQAFVRCHLGDVVLGLRLPSEHNATDAVMLTLADWEQALQATTPTVTLKANRRASSIVWPSVPNALAPCSPVLLKAFAEARLCVATEPGKYACQRLQLHGSNGQVVATDGQQVLFAGGFRFPFAEGFLIPAIPLFESKDWQNLTNVQVGLGDGWFYLDAAPWCVWLKLDAEGRFPDASSVLPKAHRFRWQFHETDVAALLRVLPGEFAKDDDARAVTLGLGARLALRWRDAGSETVHELPLPHSTASGQAATVVLNRDQLALSLKLGFRHFQGHHPEQPIAGVAGERQHVLLTLPASGALAGSTTPDGSSVIETPSRTPRRTATEPLPALETESPSLDPLTEVEALRVALGEALQRVMRLMQALKHTRKERRTLADVFTRLRQLQL